MKSPWHEVTSTRPLQLINIHVFCCSISPLNIFCCAPLFFKLHLSLSGQRDLLLSWAHFCGCDVPRPPEFPPAAVDVVVPISGCVCRVSVQDVEWGRAPAHLWPSAAWGPGLVVPAWGQSSSAGPQGRPSGAGAQCRWGFSLSISCSNPENI